MIYWVGLLWFNFLGRILQFDCTLILKKYHGNCVYLDWSIYSWPSPASPPEVLFDHKQRSCSFPNGRAFSGCISRCFPFHEWSSKWVFLASCNQCTLSLIVEMMHEVIQSLDQSYVVHHSNYMSDSIRNIDTSRSSSNMVSWKTACQICLDNRANDFCEWCKVTRKHFRDLNSDSSMQFQVFVCIDILLNLLFMILCGRKRRLRGFLWWCKIMRPSTCTLKLPSMDEIFTNGQSSHLTVLLQSFISNAYAV